MPGSKEEALQEARELLEGVAPETANEEDIYVTLPRWVVASLVVLIEGERSINELTATDNLSLDKGREIEDISISRL